MGRASVFYIAHVLSLQINAMLQYNGFIYIYVCLYMLIYMNNTQIGEATRTETMKALQSTQVVDSQALTCRLRETERTALMFKGPVLTVEQGWDASCGAPLHGQVFPPVSPGFKTIKITNKSARGFMRRPAMSPSATLEGHPSII